MKIMRASVKKKFEPIELTLTLESLRELEMMRAIFNASAAGLTAFVNEYGDKKSVYFTTEEINLIKNKSNLYSMFSGLLNEYQ